jgi:hypothetical protein
MTVETASYVSELNDTLPGSSDLKSEGDNHLRLLKTVLKTQFPNFGTTAIAATAAQVNYLVGVTSAVQTQLNTLTTNKAAKAGDTYTGAHDFTGATLTAATQSPGDNSTKVCTTAFATTLAFSAVLPGQFGNAGRYIQTNGASASWQGIHGPINVISGNTAATLGNSYVLTASLTLTLPASPVAGDEIPNIVDFSGLGTATVARNGKPIMGLSEDLVIDTQEPFALVYVDGTRGWVLFA